jgi:hypothetical protein
MSLFLLQNEKLELDDYEYILQIYGNDFPLEYNDISYGSDSIGHLYIKWRTGQLHITGLSMLRR